MKDVYLIYPAAFFEIISGFIILLLEEIKIINSRLAFAVITWLFVM